MFRFDFDEDGVWLLDEDDKVWAHLDWKEVKHELEKHCVEGHSDAR